MAWVKKSQKFVIFIENLIFLIMLFLKAFAVGILVCFSTALNCLGQKVELKGSKIIVDGNFYATIENFPNPINTDFYLKLKKN